MVAGCGLKRVTRVVEAVCLASCGRSSEKQLGGDSGRAMRGLGEGAQRRLFHLTQLPREIPCRQGVYLHHRR